MKVFGVFVCLLSAAFALAPCYDNVCAEVGDVSKCNARYGDFTEEFEKDLSRFMNLHFDHSYQYLLLSSYFKNYEKNRHGFEKLYRKLSDDTWDQSVDLIKYITKRGGNVKLQSIEQKKFQFPGNTLDMTELESLAAALDGQKVLAVEANDIHRKVTKSGPNVHDAEVGSYLENEFVHKFADRIRDLSGYANDLIKMLGTAQQERSLSLFLFDEFLQKSL